jgi:hypothetical protein
MAFEASFAPFDMSNAPSDMSFEMAGARTVPVRSGWQRRNLENSPVAFIVEYAADGDRPRSGQIGHYQNSRRN